MAKWAVVQNGTVSELYNELPVTWKNVSNLNCASVPELKTLNWYPVVIVMPSSFDATKLKINPTPKYVVQADRVEEVYETVPLSYHTPRRRLPVV